MKKIIKLVLVLCTALFLVACGTEKGTADNKGKPWPSTVKYSNLNDQASRDLLAELMTDAGIDTVKQQTFFMHVDQINALMEQEELTDGFENLTIGKTKYDPYDLQDRWNAKYPDFLGYNCRITAYSLFSDFLDVPLNAEIRDEFVLMDAGALEADDSGIPTSDAQHKFFTLYSAVPTENTKDPSAHVKNWQRDWADRGISFITNQNASLISVLFHDQLDGDQLFVGHTGILFPAQNGKFYFLEKIAFQEPYQLCEFAAREDLSDYLMAKYDIAYDQPTASPVILENDQLMSGYRIHSSGK